MDVSQITDTGPEIMVVDENRNTTVPLKKFEAEKMLSSPATDRKNNSSIMDAVRRGGGGGHGEDKRGGRHRERCG